MLSSYMVLTAISSHRNMGYYVPCCPGKIALIRKRLHENQMMVNGQVSSAFFLGVEWLYRSWIYSRLFLNSCTCQLYVALGFKEHSHDCHLHVWNLQSDQRHHKLSQLSYSVEFGKITRNWYFLGFSITRNCYLIAATTVSWIIYFFYVNK